MEKSLTENSRFQYTFAASGMMDDGPGADAAMSEGFSYPSSIHDSDLYDEEEGQDRAAYSFGYVANFPCTIGWPEFSIDIVGLNIHITGSSFPPPQSSLRSIALRRRDAIGQSRGKRILIWPSLPSNCAVTSSMETRANSRKTTIP